MPSPSANSKFVLSIPKIFKHTQFFNHTQNVFGILKSGILLHKLDYLSILKTFWVYFKNLSLLKNLSILKENFGSADGLGINILVFGFLVFRLSNRENIYLDFVRDFESVEKFLIFYY